MKKVFLVLIMLVIAASSYAQTSIVGRWKTIDDESGKPKSIVEIYEKGGKYYGKVVELFRTPDEDPDPNCIECDEDDSRYNQRIIGMEIIRDMELDDDEYEEGTILDPNNGSVYDCKLWVEEGNLMVRGYIAFLYRTQTWFKYEE
ncbi:MAG: DUF2147 domain-containing protein [Reichenbachiella sp.]